MPERVMVCFAALTGVRTGMKSVPGYLSLQESQRDCTRFLTVQDCNLPLKSPNLEVYRFTRVPFGMTSSPFLLSGSVTSHLQDQDDNLVKVCATDFYVDNFVRSDSDVDTAVERYQKLVSSLIGTCLLMPLGQNVNKVWYPASVNENYKYYAYD